MALTAIQRQWQRRVDEWRASGLTSTAFCAGRGFTPGALRHYAHYLARRAPSPKAPLRLVRVERVRDVAVESAASSAITVEIGAARVIVPTGADAATLATVLDALTRSTSGRR
jgi:hypothetical protein